MNKYVVEFTDGKALAVQGDWYYFGDNLIVYKLSDGDEDDIELFTAKTSNVKFIIDVRGNCSPVVDNQ